MLLDKDNRTITPFFLIIKIKNSFRLKLNIQKNDEKITTYTRLMFNKKI